jgi:2-polyprenyl-6-methoxyphenol hydroxylase-like FAD-dependent oxidoreductase
LLEGSVVDVDGRVLQALSLDPVSGARGVALHRQRLLDELAKACPSRVELSARVIGFEQTHHAVTAKLADGSVREGAALIGCDGLHSNVRRALRGDDPLLYAGYTTWRGVARGVESGVGGTMEVWGTGKRFGVVPIGHEETYWFAVADAEPGGSDSARPLDDLRATFGGWPAPIETVLAATLDAAVIRTDTHDRDPISSWIDGRVALLGDAAHPMTPNLGQGAGQAVEDAVALARALDHWRDDVPEALRRYERCRLERANWFVLQSRRLGQMAHWKSGFARSIRDFLLRWTPDSVTRKSVAKMYFPAIDPLG